MMTSLDLTEKYTSIITAHAASLLANNVNGDLIENDYKKEAVDLLDTILAFADTSQPGSKFWKISRPEPPCRWFWGCRPTSEAVEMTAYVIQSLVLWGREREALESVKWLGKQRNSMGGFVSTQDTVVALHALSMYSQRVTKIPLDMTVRVNLVKQPNSQFTWFSSQLGEFRMDETNKLLLQKLKVEELPSNLTVETFGSGCALVQTVLRFDSMKINVKSCGNYCCCHLYRYNTPEAPQNSEFTLTATQRSYSLNVCGKVWLQKMSMFDFHPTHSPQYTGSLSETGMVLMEVELISGEETF